MTKRKPETRQYRPTELAGPYVAGRRVDMIRDEAGEDVRDPAWTVELTEPQARYELAAGAIEEVPAEPAGGGGSGAGAGKGGTKPKGSTPPAGGAVGERP